MSVLDELRDSEALRELAIELDGRPIPRVRMTEREFVAWCPEDVRAEWVDGEVVIMSPANTEHNALTVWLTRVLGEVIEYDDLGTPLAIESQVRLMKVKSRRLPDLLFVSKARHSIIKKTYLDGAPDLAIEIVSPDSENRDRREKYIEYEASGVREYWIIDPLVRKVDVYTLERNRKFKAIEEKEGRIQSKVLKKLWLKPAWLWKSPLPKVVPILKELGVR